MHGTHRILTVLTTLALVLGAASAQSGPAPSGHILVPGYQSNNYATMPYSPTGLAYDDAGNLYVLMVNGLIRVVADTDLDGVAEAQTDFFDGRTVFNFPATGIEFHNGWIYVSHEGVITRLMDTNGDLVADLTQDILTGLPADAHQNNGLAFDANDKMYFALGSQTDHGPEPDPQSATIMCADDDGQNLQIFATGVRNSYDVVWHPTFGLIGGDNGPNADPANPAPVDEMNVIVQGGDYGYPTIYGNPPMGSTTKKPLQVLFPHASPAAFDFDYGRQFSGFENEAYIPLFATGAGRIIKMLVFEHPVTGEFSSQWQVFAQGFTNAIDTKISPFGEVMVADFTTRKLVRIVAVDEARIRIFGTPRIGNVVVVKLQGNPTDYVFVALSQSTSPGYPLPGGRVFPLDVNDILFYVTAVQGNIINRFLIPDQLDSMGRRNNIVLVPNYPPIIDTVWSICFLAWNLQAQLTSVAAPVTFFVMEHE